MEARFRAERDRVVLDALPGVIMGLAALQAVLAVIHGMFGSPAERPFFFVDAASAAVGVGLRLALGRGALPVRWAQPLVAGCAGTASLIVLAHLRVIGDPLQSLMLALVILGSGSILLSFPWLALVATATLAGWLVVMMSLGFPPGSLRLGVALVGASGLAAMILAARRRSFLRLEDLRAQREGIIQDLTAALANVKTLSGLIPICASCKKIRDDKGYWNQVEVYVRDHSDAEFSHGICPDCMKTLYGK
jgi:hypothetical protein